MSVTRRTVMEPLQPAQSSQTRTIVNPVDRVEAPIIACNDNLPTSRTRRPSTPSKVWKPGGIASVNNTSLTAISDNTLRKGRDDKKQEARIRSASAGRDHKSEMCSRYWAYLFENLERSISEIYEGCEKEENIRQCKEVVLILENYTRDFKNLIEWFHLKWSYEKTPPPMRPTALAWEIRKPSFCLLPHTRAYEKLFGLSSSIMSKDPITKDRKGSLPANAQLDPIGLSRFFTECMQQSNNIADVNNSNSNPTTGELNNKVQPGSCHGSPKPTSPCVVNTTKIVTTTTTPDNLVIDSCENNTTNSVPKSTAPIVVDIGLQTDLEEDPDIYYFAGGRTVACQTDYSDEYGPLSPISFKSTPVILVLNTSDSDMENSFVNENSNPNLNCCETKILIPPLLPQSTENNPPPILARTPPVTDSPLIVVESSVHADADVSVVVDVSCEIDSNSNSSNNNSNTGYTSVPVTLTTSTDSQSSTCSINNRPTTPIETKSSATQLSAGVLIDETPAEVKAGLSPSFDDQNGASETTRDDLQVGGKNGGNDVSDSDKATLNQKPVPPPVSIPVKSTFAEKAKNGMLRQNQCQAKSVSSYLNKVGLPVGNSKTLPSGGGSTSTLPRTRVTYASSNKGSGGSVIGGSSTLGRGRAQGQINGTFGSTSRSGSIGQGLQGVQNQKAKAAPIPNYRSNIASRCRTAVNTGQTTQQQDSVQLQQQQPQPQTKDNKSIAKISTKALTVSSVPSGGANAGAGAISANSSFANNVSITSTSSSLLGLEGSGTPHKIKSPSARELLAPTSGSGGGSSNAANSKRLSCGITPATDNSRFPDKKAPTASSGAGTLVGNNNKWKGQQGNTSQSQSATRPGMTRSKSMINPILAKSQNNVSRLNTVKKHPPGSDLKAPGNTSGSFKKLHSNSYVSLPDETSCRRRSNTVDEDGWETVKARSSRSKWSSSNSSLASSNANQSRNSLDKGITSAHNNNSVQNGTKISTCSSTPEGVEVTNSRQIKIVHNGVQGVTESDMKNGLSNGVKDVCDDESSVDEEEIKKKEADLDNAIREEELLEEELLQVEKDFERIENDNDNTTEDGTITDSEHAASPEVLDAEFEIENDHFFFVSMDDQETAKIEELPPREPGRILSLREKLMSPAKKCDGAETLKRYEAKLAKAERNREKLLQSKFNRYVELSDRFEALNETTKKLVSERAELIAKAEERRKRAAEKRQQYLKSIRRKAHDEDSKAKEIAFINLLEAQNKRHDYLVSAQEVEERLQTIQEERRLKLEERAGKASQVIYRQSHIKKDWQAKLKEIQEKRRKADERITREKEERAKERSEIAQEKARDREERISALNAAKQAEKEELQKKIKQKQEDTARRHEENMEQIRQKAIELGTPRTQEESSATTSVRICTLCKVILQSEIHEMQHIRGRAHLDAVKKLEKASAAANASDCNGSIEGFGLKFIADVQADKVDAKVQHDKNRHKAAKKHSKKLMQKLMESGTAFEKTEKESRSEKQWGDPNLKSKIRKNILEVDRLIGLFINNKGSPSAATSLDRLMVDIRRAAVKNVFIKEAIIGMNGISVALKVLECKAVDLPLKSKVTACEMIQGFVVGSLNNGLFILRSTAVCAIMNICAERWSTLIPDDNRWLCGSPLGTNEPLPTDVLIEALVALLFNLLQYVPDPFHGVMKKGSSLTEMDIQAIKNRTHDIIGYLVASGVIDRISVYCGGVRGPVDEQPAVAQLLIIFIDFLVVLIYALQFCWGEDPTGCIMCKKEPDTTQLIAALETSELAGTVSMAYSLVLHQGAPTRPRTADADSTENPPSPGNMTADVVKSTLCLINAMARLDIITLQNVLGSEAVSLQFRHIASQLLWQVVPLRTMYNMRRLITELIIALGNFTVGNKHNQTTIQSGQTPTVLQQLCTLPEEYFTDSKYSFNFLPTLLAATHGCAENREILMKNNVNLDLLDNYLHSESEEGTKNVIIRRLLWVMTEVKGSTSSLASGKGSGKKAKGSSNKANTVISNDGKKPIEEKNTENGK